jgi:hypothetical protein
MLGTPKNVRIRRVPDVAVWFWTDCDEEHVTAYRQNVEMSTLVGRAVPSFFSVLEEVCAPSRLRTREAADGPVSIVGNGKAKSWNLERI